MKTSVNIIKIFDGPRHRRLELIWKNFHKQHEFDLHIFDNTKLRLPHDQALNRMWEQEQRRDSDVTIFTEFDFIPGIAFLDPTFYSEGAVHAAEYVVRDPESKNVLPQAIPGAWYIHIDREWTVPLDFSNFGTFNDPANGIPASLLIGVDCYPEHYGMRYLDKYGYRIGEHLFWSRHYNDPPGQRPASFDLDDILRKVDKRIGAGK
jgi:hypothetical protein